MLDLIPEDAGSRLMTGHGGIAHFVQAPGSLAFTGNMHLIEIVLAPVNKMEFTFGSSCWQGVDVQMGTVVTIPANVSGFASWSSVKESAIIALQPSYLQDLAACEIGAVEPQWPALVKADAFALGIAQMMKAELLRKERANLRYVDALLTQLSVHLLRVQASDGPPAKAQGRLSSYNAKRAQAFMKENLSRKVTLADLAAVCELSPSHFVSAFKATFGQSPYRYLLGLRLAYAEMLLARRNMPIVQVAHLSGFSSQSHLTSAMSKYRGETPFRIQGRSSK
ncbi:AraC family transcriptional regulator [Phyllobacterium salinisoli]|uniref:AraC family transcriptional regulator n=1 Tax=Phyllobacterium salinisoli TaxID=1899321 RepID=A0A368JWT6_9HYPH|nr:AraC family transcriptional regulator [Phyllobacterium salinisoli]RCS21616.1 AraC family transcriptional regulator [Phyllobacterium salinisoli]